LQSWHLRCDQLLPALLAEWVSDPLTDGREFDILQVRWEEMPTN